MLDISHIQLSKLKKHQLSNEGCRCEMCQKLNHKQIMKIEIENVEDHQSQFYGAHAKEYYLKVINKMADWQKKPRKLRFALPQICVYENSLPSLLIIKKNEDQNIKIIRDKSKMHMFEIIQFFLEGFVYHNPQPVKKMAKRKASSFVVGNHAEKHKNECIIIAKYRNNFHNMLTLAQMQGLFKSRQKYMRDGLIYLQTLVCTKDYTETRINLNLREFMKNESYENIYQRARLEVRMLHEEVKSSDIDFVTEKQQIEYQNQLRSKSMREYLHYLTIKIVLALSKTQTQIISEAVFKYVHSKNKCYLLDVRVTKVQSNQQFWATAAMKAFQYKLSRRMSMMDIGSSTAQDEAKKRNLGRKAHNISMWLEKNTEQEWDEMKVIRTRLQRLQKQKKSLMESQSMIEGNMDTVMNKSFKIRNVQKR